jgi:uncharacterized protein (DUF433 family)
MLYKFIESIPEVLGGKPCIKNTRISIELILEWLANGATVADISKKYPQLSAEAIHEAIMYSASFMKNEILVEMKAVA